LVRFVDVVSNRFSLCRLSSRLPRYARRDRQQSQQGSQDEGAACRPGQHCACGLAR